MAFTRRIKTERASKTPLMHNFTALENHSLQEQTKLIPLLQPALGLLQHMAMKVAIVSTMSLNLRRSMRIMLYSPPAKAFFLPVQVQLACQSPLFI